MALNLRIYLSFIRFQNVLYIRFSIDAFALHFYVG